MFRDAFRNAEAEAIAQALIGGSLRLYDGRKLLAELRLAGFRVTRGKLTALPIAEVLTVAAGNAQRGEVVDAAGVTYFDGEVGNEIVLKFSAFDIGAVVSCRSLTVTF